MEKIKPTIEKQWIQSGGVTSLDFDPKASRVVAGSFDKTVTIFHLDPSKRSLVFGCNTESVLSVCFNNTGNFIASGGRDGSVHVHQAHKDGVTSALQLNCGPVRSVEFCNDTALLLTATDDKIVRLICIERKKTLNTYEGHNNLVRSARFSPSDLLIVSGSDDSVVKIWDRREKQEITSYKAKSGVTCVAFHPSENAIAYGTQEGIVSICDIRINRQVQVYEAKYGVKVTGIDFHDSKPYLISGYSDGSVIVADTVEGRPVMSLQGYVAEVNDVKFSKHKNMFAAGGNDSKSQLKVFAMNMKEESHEASKYCPENIANILQDKVYISKATSKPNEEKRNCLNEAINIHSEMKLLKDHCSMALKELQSQQEQVDSIRNALDGFLCLSFEELIEHRSKCTKKLKNQLIKFRNFKEECLTKQKNQELCECLTAAIYNLCKFEAD